MTRGSALNILVLAHDLSDTAIQKRVAMLHAGGAMVTVAGFRRTSQPFAGIAGITECTVVNFGQTYNQNFVQRTTAVLREVICLHRHRALFQKADVIIARNLEMLAVAVRGQSLSSSKPVIVYECLDIHRLLLNRGPIGTVLRSLEGWLSKRASALITSSPAFVTNYFNARSKVRLPVKLLENKILNMSGAPIEQPIAPTPPPWVIGWFGIIRCKKSLRILSELVRQSGGKIEVIIRGRPALDQFDDFYKSVSETPGLTFGGPYKRPVDLHGMYQKTHFTWAIDFYEEGLNSSWLLPNRLYEGSAYGSIPIAVASVETGKFLERLNVGVTLANPLSETLATFFKNLTPQHYNDLKQSVKQVPTSIWEEGEYDCIALVEYLRGLRKVSHV